MTKFPGPILAQPSSDVPSNSLIVSFFPDRFLTSMQLPQNCHAEDSTHMLDEIDRCKKEWNAMSVYVGPDPEGLRQTPGMVKIPSVDFPVVS